MVTIRYLIQRGIAPPVDGNIQSGQSIGSLGGVTNYSGASGGTVAQ
jgi:hypothetical protein